MDTQEAVRIVEQKDADTEQYLDAMQHLIDSAVIWQLPSRIGHEAMSLVEQGLCQAPDWTDGE